MIFKEEKGNVFELGPDYYLVHCISADCKMGAGIAVDFNKKFRLRNRVLMQHPQVGKCILVGEVFNLVTKERYYGKPTYKTLETSLMALREQVIYLQVGYLGMPKIGCGLDKLQWPKVRDMIKDIFIDRPMYITVRSL